MPNTLSTPARSESRLGLLWCLSAVSALVLCLAVNGTLSSWTQAIVTHNSNTVSTGTGNVALSVGLTVGGGSRCDSSAGADNTTTCAIDLFGNLGTAVTNLQPGGAATTSVTLTNTGDTNATTLNIAPGPCTGSTALCSNLLVSMTCTGDATKSFALGTMDAFGTSDGNFTNTGGVPIPKLTGNTVCEFAISLPLTAPLSTRGQTISQNVVWTLTA
jgi:hypothetical protein